MPHGPDADDGQENDGPRRFISKWLAYDETAPTRVRKLWMMIATVTALLAASALLAWLA
jgi:hypothetical protein